MSVSFLLIFSVKRALPSYNDFARLKIRISSGRMFCFFYFLFTANVPFNVCLLLLKTARGRPHVLVFRSLSTCLLDPASPQIPKSLLCYQNSHLFPLWITSARLKIMTIRHMVVSGPLSPTKNPLMFFQCLNQMSKRAIYSSPGLCLNIDIAVTSSVDLLFKTG